jgi:hypothetical protein
MDQKHHSQAQQAWDQYQQALRERASVQGIPAELLEELGQLDQTQGVGLAFEYLGSLLEDKQEDLLSRLCGEHSDAAAPYARLQGALQQVRDLAVHLAALVEFVRHEKHRAEAVERGETPEEDRDEREKYV